VGVVTGGLGADLPAALGAVEGAGEGCWGTVVGVETYYCLLQQGRDDDIFEVEVTDEEAKVGDVESDECEVKLSL